MSPSDTGAGTFHWPRCVVGTRTEATSPCGPSSTTAVAASSGPWFALITSVHTPAVGHLRLRAYTPSRDVSLNASLIERRSPFTIPSAVPVTMYPVGVPWWNECTNRNAPRIDWSYGFTGNSIEIQGGPARAGAASSVTSAAARPRERARRNKGRLRRSGYWSDAGEAPRGW